MSPPPVTLVQLLGDLRRRAWQQAALVSSAWAAALAAGLRMAGMTPGEAALIAAGVLLAGLLIFRFGAGWRRLDPMCLAEHLDRRIPEIEESATLLLAEPDRLQPMQRMQRRRAAEAFSLHVTASTHWLPRMRWRTPFMLLVLSGVIFAGADTLRGLWPAAKPDPHTSLARRSGVAAGLERVEITISPPDYTRLPPETVSRLDLELPENSRVEWRLWLSRDGEYQLDLGDGVVLELERGGDGTWSASATVQRTGLYQLSERRGADTAAIGDIHTLTVKRDAAPRIRLLAPSESLLEIPLGEPPGFHSEVYASDDFGLGTVQIHASVAKGSGEGVKFRDEIFAFDTNTLEDDGRVYTRFWDLPSMGMAPGDEVYFFVTATDNRAPEPNLTRSDTVTVRWLDDAEPVLAAEGFGIDFVPDYFKSQRQIIIETEQLIEDREALDRNTFDHTSRALGQAQSDLKQRYGQYLGDEFGEGEGAGFSQTPRAAEIDSEDHETGEDAARDALEGLGHEHEDDAGPAIDTSGSAADLVARFAHDHGAAEIGPITARNPVGMMKRSIGNMWQAELHLLLSEPEKALPFEYEALKYLNLARQAERIYTARLGFEPPPVSEERRLTGELDDVHDARRQASGFERSGDARLFRSLFEALGEANPASGFSESELRILQAARQRMTELAQERPALIAQAAVLQRMERAGSPAAANCPDCLAQVQSVAWQLSESDDPQPRPGLSRPGLDSPMSRAYLDTLEQERP